MNRAATDMRTVISDDGRNCEGLMTGGFEAITGYDTFASADWHNY